MPYVICQHPATRIDIMALQEFWPELASIIQRTGCTYKKEDKVELPNGQNYILLRDVQALKGYQLGDFIIQVSGMVYSLEQRALINGSQEDIAPKKFYVMIRPRGKKGKKDAGEVREEVHTGREGGDPGESAGDIQPGQDPGSC